MPPGTELGTTSCVVLGLVSKRPMSGYELAALATRSVANFWPISKSQVYAELSRLETDGYIVGTHVEQNKRPDKRRYELTRVGEEALAEWVQAGGFATDRMRSGFLAKFFFALEMTHDQRIALLNEYRVDVETYRLQLQSIMDKLEGRPDAAFARSTALYGLLGAEAKLTWVEQMIASLSEQSAPG